MYEKYHQKNYVMSELLNGLSQDCYHVDQAGPRPENYGLTRSLTGSSNIKFNMAITF